MRLVPAPPVLADVGAIHLPRRACDHYFVKEALACATIVGDSESSRGEIVLGTHNEGPPSVQLYGWGANVGRHADRKGVIYFSPVLVRFSKVFAEIGRSAATPESWLCGALGRDPDAPRLALRLRLGRVYRLWDFAWHWTVDSAPVVCLYVGVFHQHEDRRAIGMLQHGALLLGERSRRAPRVSRGFRAPARWEGYVIRGSGSQVVPLEQARAAGEYVVPCSVCEEPAFMLDRHFPYHWELNRCRGHLVS